jgi:hypothetical protein
MMAHPFLPMTNEILEKLTRMVQDSNSTAKFFESQPVLGTETTKSISVTNPSASEENHNYLCT